MGCHFGDAPFVIVEIFIIMWYNQFDKPNKNLTKECDCMNCPYCNVKMKLGQIEADNLLSWKPDGERSTGGTRWANSPNSIVLAKYFLLAPASVDAFYCKECKKIIIDISEETNE